MIGFEGVSQRHEIASTIAEGAVFLCDPARSGGLKPLPGEPVVSSAACIAFRTQAAELGPVTLVFAVEEQDYDGVQIFEGTVPTVGRKLAFTTSAGGVLIQVAVTSAETHVRVHANHRKVPTKLVCIVEDPSDRSGLIGWAEEIFSWLHRLFRH